MRENISTPTSLGVPPPRITAKRDTLAAIHFGRLNNRRGITGNVRLNSQLLREGTERHRAIYKVGVLLGNRGSGTYPARINIPGVQSMDVIRLRGKHNARHRLVR